MRYLLLLLGLISTAYGQFAPTSAKTAFKNGISIGTRDSTAYTTNDSLVVVINRQGRMMYRSTDGYWKVLSNAAASDYVPYTGAVDNVTLGNFRLTARSLRTDSIYANGSGGMYLLTNSGNAVAHWGGGGSIEVDFKGFAGYDANRSASYTARSFTDKGYVDSSAALRVRYTDTAAMLAGYKTYYPRTAISLTTTGSSGAATYNNATGVLNIPQYAPDLSGYVPYTGATANVNLGAFDLTADVITGATGSFSSSGSSNTLDITHSSGSGIALNITKSGNGEGLYINKTSGSGNAATIIGTLNATTLVKSGGTSSQFLKADGSVDGNTYALVSDLNGYVPTSRTLTINGTSFDLSANRSWSVGTVTAVTASAPLSSSGGTTPNITISQATTSTNGFLSSTDWNTFNNKQAQLNGTGFVRFSGTTPSYITGTSSQFVKADGSLDGTSYATAASISGTTNYIPKFTSSSAIGNSVMQESSSNIGIGITPTQKLSLFTSGATATYAGFSNGSTSSEILVGANAGGDLNIFNPNNTKVRIFTNSIERATFEADGSTTLTGALSGTSLSMSSTVSGASFRTTGATPSNTAGFANSLYLESAIPSMTLSNTGAGTGKYTLGVTGTKFGLWNNTTSAYEIFIDPTGSGLTEFTRGISGTSLSMSGGGSLATSSGNVGIGTTNPNNTLDVRNTGIMQIRMGTDGGARPYWQIGRDNVTSGDFIVANETSEQIRVTGSGQILVNNATNDGTNKLIVNGGVKFGTGGTTTITAAGAATFSGNVGINATLQAWGSPFLNSALQIGYSGFIAGRSDAVNQIQLGSNAYFNGTNWIYKISDFASRYYQAGGSHVFSYAASGTAGAAITFIDALTLSSTGAATFASSVTATDYRGSTASYSSAGTISANITTAFLTGNAYTINMPTATNGKVLIIIAETGLNTNGITLNGVNGGTYLLSCHHSLVLVGNGTTWKIASDYQNSAPCS